MACGKHISLWLSSNLQEPLPLQTELSPLESPPAAHVHTKTVDRISPGNFFHQHSSHGDLEAVLRDSPYTVRWQSWTSINFKVLHRVLHLQTKASPKKNSFYHHPICPKDNWQQKKKCSLQVVLFPTMKVWTFITFNNISRATAKSSVWWLGGQGRGSDWKKPGGSWLLIRGSVFLKAQQQNFPFHMQTGTWIVPWQNCQWNQKENSW